MATELSETTLSNSQSNCCPRRPRPPKNNDKKWRDWNREAEVRAKECGMAVMPSLDHLSLQDYNDVYEPAEDTFLLLDALFYEFEHQAFTTVATRTTTSRPFVVLEIGCGTGVASVFFRMQWKNRPEYVTILLQSFVTDVNPKAIAVALQTDRVNSYNETSDDAEGDEQQPKLTELEATLCDLATPLLTRLEHQVDVLLFNPPYVPTDDREVGDSGISAAWAGGEHGRRVVDRAIPQIATLLRPTTGVAYLVTVDENKPAQLAHVLWQQQQHNPPITLQPLLRRRAQNEFLTIQKLSFHRGGGGAEHN